MKTPFIVLGWSSGALAALAVFASGVLFPMSSPQAAAEKVATDRVVLAAAGCCKERSSESKPWRKTQTDFDSCKKKNASEGDNIYKPSGLIWWDLAC